MNILVKEILDKYCESLPEDRRKSLLRHCEEVTREAVRTAARQNNPKIDMQFLEEAAMLHDIGICLLDENTPYIRHGVLGRDILEREGLPAHALVCERHVGAGLSKKEAKILGLPVRDMTPKTIEEKIICYADKMFSKSKRGKHTLAAIRAEFAGYGEEQLKRFDDLHKQFS